jgi:hypothetical protein
MNLENNVTFCFRTVGATSIPISILEPLVEGKLEPFMPYFGVFDGRLSGIGRFRIIGHEIQVVGT